MRVIVESELTVTEKIEGRHYVKDEKCECGEYCFSFDLNGRQGQCRDFKRLLTGVKLCGWERR